MTARHFIPALLLSLLAAPLSSPARLGENEAQSQARYGEPKPQFSSPLDKPLLPGAKEVIYHFEGWRVRVALVNNLTCRVEYVHVPEGSTPQPVTDADIKTILEAEKGAYSWREQKPKTGSKDLNALKSLFDGRTWERADHATASLKANILFVLETRDADAIEKKLTKQPVATPVKPVPKF